MTVLSAHRQQTRGSAMSYAIFELDLRMPSVSVLRLLIGDETHWVAQCEACGQSGRPQRLLSAAVENQYGHGCNEIAASTSRASSTGVPSVVPTRRLTRGQLLSANGVRLSRSNVTRKDVA